MAEYMRWKEIQPVHGSAGLSGLAMEIDGGYSHCCIPGCPAQPDNMTQTLLYLLNQARAVRP